MHDAGFRQRPRFPRPRGDGPPFCRKRELTVTPHGFPAHAGMDHWLLGQRPRIPGGVVSPPTRGWTVNTRFEIVEPESRFPRPRGDGPVQTRCAETRHYAAGFPAHAGMDLCPRHLPAIRCILTVSPPTRGWTLAEMGHQPEGGTGVSPPTRGWTRTATWLEGRPGTSGFPRPRGDGPSTNPAPRAALEDRVSPPTRGWTGAVTVSAS